MKPPYYLIAVFIASILTSLLIKWPLYAALGLTYLWTLSAALRRGISPRSIITLHIKGLKSISSVIILLSTIMIVIPLWIQGGTIPALLALGFVTLKTANLLLVAFVLATILSMTIGTAMGTMSILMSSFIAMAMSASVPLPLIVGAVVSGAYIGDRSAMMSGSVHLNASVTETNAKDNFIYMMRTLLPAMCIGILFYSFLGAPYAGSPDIAVHFEKSATLIHSHFSITPIVWTPLGLLILLLLFKRSMKEALLVSLGTTIGLLFYQGQSWTDILPWMISGTKLILSETLTLSSNGFMGILSVLLVIVFSTLVNELFDALNIIKPLLTQYFKNTKRFSFMSLKVGLLSLLVSVITCSQTLMIVICGQHMKSYYDRLGFDRKDLMLTIADYGIITVALIPWNINGQMIEALSGVATVAYAPFAVICLLMPLMNALYSLIRQKKYNH
jgi:Na+:H+ antiporter, NhaC family